MLIKKGMQGTNYYNDPEVEKFRYNPYRKANREMVEDFYKWKAHSSFPRHVIVETSSLCNLKCEFCNREVMGREEMNMSMDTFKKIVDECTDHKIYSLSLYALGEPLLNPDIRNMIIYAKGKGIPYIDVSTNGMFSMYSLIGSGLNEIIISLDGFKDTHEKLRKGADYDKIIGNIDNILAYKKTMRQVRPLVRLQIIDLPETHDDIPKFINEWIEKVDVIYVKRLEGMTHSLGDKLVNKEQIQKKCLGNNQCKQLSFVLTVNSNGDIAKCCHDPKGKSVVGNISAMSLIDAWNKEIDLSKFCEYCTDKLNW